MHTPSPTRYAAMPFRRCGAHGLQLPALSLGFWHNFGGVDDHANSRAMALRALDLGINHFDLADNYGPPPGSAELTLGRILREDLASHRDELVISSKAGHLMWPGPHGDWGSRKHLVAGMDQSLKRMGLDYVDIFYHHRPDPNTPLEETMGALDHLVRQGKALYVGLSKYPPDLTRKAAQILRQMGTPSIIHQSPYSMLNRTLEGGLLDAVAETGMGCIVFSPLAQGLLSDKYLQGIPADSRAAKPHGFLQTSQVTDDKLDKVRRLQPIAAARGQSLAQLALAWVLRHPTMTSALIGASRLAHIEEAVGALKRLDFSAEELAHIEVALGDA